MTHLENTTFSMLAGTIGLVVLATLFEHPLDAIPAAPFNIHAAVLYLAVGGSLLAYVLWFRGIHQLGAARTSIFFNLAPVFTMLVSTVLGAPPNVWQLIGAAGVILGVVCASGLVKVPSGKRTMVV